MQNLYRLLLTALLAMTVVAGLVYRKACHNPRSDSPAKQELPPRMSFQTERLRIFVALWKSRNTTFLTTSRKKSFKVPTASITCGRITSLGR